MNNCIKRSQRMLFLMLCATTAIGLVGCAGSSDVREQERARYDALETELIDTLAAEERRRQADMRIAAKLQQMDAERLRIKQQRLNEASIATLPTVQAITLTASDNSEKTLDPIWTFAYVQSPLDGAEICAVVSEPVIVLNGALDTRVRVIIGKKEVFLRTDATFDTDIPETGFRVDAGFPIAFDRFHNELTAVIDANYARFITALKTGTTLSAAFAYSPQLSPAETYSVDFTLESVDSVLLELADCNTSQNDENTPALPANS